MTETTAVIATGGNERALVMTRLRVRQRASRLQADCDYLLDEASRIDHRSWVDALTRAAICIRHFSGLARRDDVGALFRTDLSPTTPATEAQRRIVSALSLSLPDGARSPLEEAILLGILGMRDAAAGLFADPTLPRPTVALVNEDNARRHRVLIVDDEPKLIRILERAITGAGHETVSAGNGRQALGVARGGGIDLIVTDIEMPEMTGIDLLQALKDDATTRHIPVIVVSGADDLFHVTRCIELGAEDHIAKPFEPRLLHARINASLERKRLHDLEQDQREGLARMVEAAEALERGTYSTATLSGIRDAGNGVGHLARVFDRMVSGVKAREGRLRERVQMLQAEMGGGRTPGASPVTTAPRRIAANAPFAIGELVTGRYEILGQLGEGGMGSVFVAMDQELHEEVAIKVIRPDVLETDASLVLRLKSEIRLARRLSHRNIIRAHDLGTWKKRHFITMELVRGVSLAELLDQRTRLGVASTLAIATQLCEALAVAHEHEVVHRDIKPANLLVSEAGLLKVMDFGIAFSAVGADHAAHTSAGVVIGTPHYMAPEILLGAKANARTDLYAVGVVLYESLTGRLPYMADMPAELVEQIHGGRAPRLVDEVPDIPPTFAELVNQQLEYDPRRRAESARELVERLAEVETVGRHGD